MWCLLYPVILLITSLGLGLADAGGPVTPPRSTLHVATLNIAHGRGSATRQLGHGRATFERNVDRIADLIRAHHPDVVALQEADAPSAWSGGFDHVNRIAERAAYQHVQHGLHFDFGFGVLRIAYGTALLGRAKLTKRASHPFRHSPPHRKGFVVAETEFDGGPVTVVSLHLHSGSSTLRRQQADELIALLRDHKQSLIVMGDFNSTWFDEQDALRRVITGLDLVAYDGDSNALNTFPATAPRKRLDWILISSDLAFVSYRNWTEKMSDHLAVEATVRRRTTTRDEAVGR